MGFTILDDCDKASTAMATALQFLPTSHPNSIFTSTNNTYDVVGLIGPYSSSSVKLVSPLLGFYDIPQISAMATDQDLSNKDQYQYFLRVVPPDQFQAYAMVALVNKFNWTYISVIYRYSSYGLNGLNNILHLTRELDICIAYSQKVPSYADQGDYNDIIRSLQRNANAKAVLLFLYPEQVSVTD